MTLASYNPVIFLNYCETLSIYTQICPVQNVLIATYELNNQC